MKLTEGILRESKEFKENITGRIALIHEVHEESDKPCTAFIVLSMDYGKVTITRFWTSPNKRTELDKIRFKVDYKDISIIETFEILLTDYSRKLE
jgi:hypothetical protein